MTAEEFWGIWIVDYLKGDPSQFRVELVFAQAYADHLAAPKAAEANVSNWGFSETIPALPKVAAEASPNCICASNCHFDCEDKLCKCPHHKAAEAPGGQDGMIPLRLVSETIHAMYLHDMIMNRLEAAAPAAPSERADELERELQVAHNVLRQHGVQCSLINPMCDVCMRLEAAMTRAGLSSQEGK